MRQPIARVNPDFTARTRGRLTPARTPSAPNPARVTQSLRRSTFVSPRRTSAMGCICSKKRMAHGPRDQLL